MLIYSIIQSVAFIFWFYVFTVFMLKLYSPELDELVLKSDCTPGEVKLVIGLLSITMMGLASMNVMTALLPFVVGVYYIYRSVNND